MTTKAASAESKASLTESDAPLASRLWSFVRPTYRPQTRLSFLFVLSDFLAIGLSLVASGFVVAVATWFFFGFYYLQEGVPGGTTRLIYVTVISVGIVTVMSLRGHYRCGVPLHRELQQVVSVLAFAMLFEGFLHYAQKDDFSRLWLVGTWLTAVPLMLLGRALVKSLVTRKDDWKIPVIVVGNDPAIDDALTVFRAEYQMGFRTVSKLVTADGVPFGNDDFVRLRAAVEPWNGAHVIFAQAFPLDKGLRAAIRYLNTERIPYSVLAPFHEMSVLNMEVLPLYRNEMVLLSPRHSATRFTSAAVKRLTDFVFAGSAIVLTLPLMLFVAAAVASDRGPVFFGHTRVGRHGRKFKCYKFRTMVQNADDMLAHHLRNNPDAKKEWVRSQKLVNDPRVTRIGKFLRRTSLDELPQLYNILKGDMSVVGPRPVTEGELIKFGDTRDYYLKMRPGVTGLWQISGRSETTYERRVYLDGWYARNWSFWHDMAIIMRTVPAVLSSRGAV